jgi:2-C-methyl-D-erythritol 4-phosphate cytidylyltransferase
MAIPPTGVILAAAGAGRRFGGPVPKALVPLAGRPMLLRSLAVFAKLPFVRQIVVVLPPAWIGRVRRAHGPELERLRVTALVPGGRRRQDSVRTGLEILTTPIVLVHDAARPLITARAIREVARAAARHGAAVLSAPAVDTVKIADRRGRVVSTPDRARVWHAQTPQGFRTAVLRAAYRAAGRADATDDTQLVERTGGKVVIVPSREANFQVTTREDLARAEKLLDRR